MTAGSGTGWGTGWGTGPGAPVCLASAENPADRATVLLQVAAPAEWRSTAARRFTRRVASLAAACARASAGVSEAEAALRVHLAEIATTRAGIAR
jgi:hypothetical protein